MMRKLVITGAAGRIGTEIRPHLAALADELILSDRIEIVNLSDKERFIPCDLTDRDGLQELLQGCGGIVHLGGIANEARWSEILEGNIDGIVNLYDAAVRAGCPRIVFASSYHVIGYHKQTDTLDSSAPLRPDGLYGASKAFGEAIAQMYHDKTGIETAIVRIGSCFPDVHSHRMMKTWISPADFVRLIERAFTAPKLGCTVLYGVSANAESWWRNDQAARIGWTAIDSSEPFRAEVEASTEPPEPGTPDDIYQGGIFTTFPINTD
jgi:uronate dehydrogenase